MRKTLFTAIMLLLVIIVTVSGCGNSSGPPTPVDPDPETVSSALTTLDTKLESLFQPDATPSVTQIRKAIQDTPGMNLLSTEEDDVIIAEIGLDGPVVVVSPAQPVGYYDPETDPTLQSMSDAFMVRSAETPRASLPKGSEALLLNGLGLGGEAYKDITPEIKKIFDQCKACDYMVETRLGSIGNYRLVKDVDVLFIKSHGTKTSRTSPPYVDKDKAKRLPTFALSSCSQVDLKDPTPKDYSEDILKRNIVYMYASTKNSWTKEWLFGITSGFVDKYWRLNPGGMVFINACSSASDYSSGFRTAVFEKGASIFIGWSEPVDTNFADQRVQHVFDRLLGANFYSPPTPNQRPFTYWEIEEELISRKMITWPGEKGEFSPSTLKFIAGFNENFGLLAPSIKYLEIDEKTSSGEKPVLTIHGTFGNKVGRVLLNDEEELPILDWGAKKIYCELDPDDAGDIVVEVDRKQSNKRRISKWQGTVTFTAEPVALAGECDMKDTITWRLKFRADIASCREKPGEQPKHRIVGFETTKKSTTDYSSVGSWRVPDSDGNFVTLYTWDGCGTAAVNKDEGDIDYDISICNCQVNTDRSVQPYLKMNIGFLGKADSKRIINPPDASPPESFVRINTFYPECYHEYNGLAMPPQRILHLPLDSNWNIQAGKKTGTAKNVDLMPNVPVKMEWTAMSVEYPPVDDREHGR